MLRRVKASGYFDALKHRQILIKHVVHLRSSLYSPSAPASRSSLLSLFHRRPLCLFSLFLHRRPSPSIPSQSSPQTPTPFSSVMLSPDPRQNSSPSLSLSLSLPLHPCHRQRQAGPHGPHTSLLSSASSPSSSTCRSLLPNWSSQPSTSASSPLFPSRCRKGRATDAFFSCFLMASSPSSFLHPHPASSAASFSFDVVLCCRHGLEVAVSLYQSLLHVRTLPPSSPPSLSSTLLSSTPVVLKNSKFYEKLN